MKEVSAFNKGKIEARRAPGGGERHDAGWPGLLSDFQLHPVIAYR